MGLLKFEIGLSYVECKTLGNYEIAVKEEIFLPLSCHEVVIQIFAYWSGCSCLRVSTAPQKDIVEQEKIWNKSTNKFRKQEKLYSLKLEFKGKKEIQVYLLKYIHTVKKVVEKDVKTE